MWTTGSTFSINGVVHTLTFVAKPPALSTCYVGDGDWRAALAADPYLGASDSFQFCAVPPTTATPPTLKDFTYRSYLDYLKEDDHRAQRDVLKRVFHTHFNLVDGRLIDHPVYARNTDAYRHHQHKKPTTSKRKVAQFLEEHKDVDIGEVFELPCGTNYREVEALWQVWASMVFFNSELVEKGLSEARGSGCMTSDARICIIREGESGQPLCSIQDSRQSALISVLFDRRAVEDLPLVVVQWDPERGSSRVRDHSLSFPHSRRLILYIIFICNVYWL